jgi:hypothetical protein
MNRIIPPLAIALLALSGVSAMAATAQPIAGIYHSVEYALSVKGSECNVVEKQFYENTWYWPGAGKTGTTEWNQEITSSGAPELRIHSYPKTPAAGVKSWHGSETSVSVPPSTKGSSKFTATLTYADQNAFLMTITFTFGNCTETLSDTLVLQGIK